MKKINIKGIGCDTWQEDYIDGKTCYYEAGNLEAGIAQGCWCPGHIRKHYPDVWQMHQWGYWIDASYDEEE